MDQTIANSMSMAGMHEGTVHNISLMSKRTANPHLARLHKDVENTIKSKSYDWKTVRVS